MTTPSTRQRIIEAADLLFYQQGFEHTSFAEIAKVVNISRGNFYHHFKTKDDILDAVIDHRMDKTRTMLTMWEQEGDTPIKRVQCFIRILIMNQSKIKLYGCPVGSLTSELAKLDHPAKENASALFTLFRTWLMDQFAQMSFSGQKTHDLAMHLLVRSQGIATLANAFQDDEFIKHEVQDMIGWLDTQIPAQEAL